MLEGLDKVRDSVLKRANAEAKQILDEARSEAEAILAGAEAEQARLDQEQAQQQEQRRSRALTRVRSMSELERRRVILEAKQHLIDETLEEAMTRLSELPDAEREAFYLNLLRDVAADGQTIRFSPLDLGIAEEVIRKSGYKLELGETDDKFTGGFVLEEGRVRWRFSFAAILGADRETYVELAARTLYSPETAEENTERDGR